MGPKSLKIDPDNLRKKFLAYKVHFNHLSFDLLGSMSLPYGSFKFGYSFKTHYYFIARRTLIAQVAKPMLSRVT